jgi:PGF-pre-PGF domain-containing protein
MKPQHGIALVLLIALIAGAAAAGGTPPAPALPHQFFGDVTIGGSPAPAGTTITAMIGDTECGSILVTDAGRYGDPDWRLGNRLLVTGTADQNGETITFLVDGAAAKETATFTSGAVTRLDLSFEKTVATPTARFKTNITTGPAPLAVAFTDTSTDADSWSWDFGDGTTSADQNPTHTYATPGTYTANLTVANAAGSSSATATITVREKDAVEIVRGPYLTGTTTTATVVNWMAQEPVAGTVEYADDAYYTAKGGYEKSVAGTAEAGFHHITLEGLTPDTLYHYRVTAGSTTTGDYTFRTFPEDGGFTFVVYGDTQRPANIKLVADRIAEEEPLFVLHTGDQVNGVESASEWNDFFRKSGRMLANTTIYTTMGNHEKNHTAYYENFGLPQRYSFTCSDAQFAVLDDNNWVDINRESAWLKDDLDSDAAWKFVAHHHPPYSSTSDRLGGWILLRVWGETMKNAGVSAVFNGHVHAYERYVVDGINYVVAGTGAGPLYRLGDEKPEGYQTSLEDTLGYTKVTLYPNGTAVAGFVKVARLSDDANVLEVYPPGSVFETYTMTRPPRADLAAVNLTVPGDITAGTACTVTGTVKNVGDAASRACSATLTAGDLGIGTAAVGALAPGETAEVSFTWTPATAGEATLTLAVDPDAEIPDVDRKNNARTVTVTVAGSGPGPAPVAAFTANVTSGVAPITVAFTDTSTGAAAWSWTFGDGGTSSKQHPVHTYLTAETYTVTLTVTNAGGSSSTTRVIIVQEIPPQSPEAAENFTLESDAVNVTIGEGGQQVTFNATAGLNVTGTDIHLQAGGLTVTIRTENLTTADNVSTGNVTGVSLASSTPLNATVGTGNVSVSFTAEMNNYNPALGITTSIYEQPSSEAREAFILAAQEDEDSEITGIAYAVYFIKTNLTGDDKIRNATLRLTVSEDWVKAHGGTDKIRIFRRGDDGSRQVLETTYAGIENGMMVFTAVSPGGFSAFAIGAVAPSSPPAPAPSRSSGGGGSQASVGAASNLKLGDRVTLPMDKTAISAVTLTADGNVKDVMVTVAKGSLPRDAEAPAGTVYQYIETNLHKAAAEDFSALQLRFAVPTAWLAAQGCTGSQVGLFRHTTDGWQEIPVEVLGEEGSDAIFSASADAFGLFAITVTGKATGVGEPTLEPIETETTPSADVTTPPAGPTTEATPTPGFGAFVALAGLGAVAFQGLRRK